MRRASKRLEEIGRGNIVKELRHAKLAIVVVLWKVHLRQDLRESPSERMSVNSSRRLDMHAFVWEYRLGRGCARTAHLVLDRTIYGSGCTD